MPITPLLPPAARSARGCGRRPLSTSGSLHNGREQLADLVVAHHVYPLLLPPPIQSISRALAHHPLHVGSRGGAQPQQRRRLSDAGHRHMRRGRDAHERIKRGTCIPHVLARARGREGGATHDILVEPTVDGGGERAPRAPQRGRREEGAQFGQLGAEEGERLAQRWRDLTTIGGLHPAVRCSTVAAKTPGRSRPPVTTAHTTLHPAPHSPAPPPDFSRRPLLLLGQAEGPNSSHIPCRVLAKVCGQRGTGVLLELLPQMAP
eukprot:scaffold5762_cov101-Isochrysis_galbana.AAC.1